MSDRAYLRPRSPPRWQVGHPARNSTSLLDSYSGGYDSHPVYHPRSSRDSLQPARSSFERVDAPPRRYLSTREPLPPPRRNPDDYDVLPRRAETLPYRPPPLSIADAGYYRPVITKSAIEPPLDFPTRSRPREDESYYLMPASSSTRRHVRAVSTGGPEPAVYPLRPREHVRDKGSRDYYERRPPQYYAVPHPRPSRDRDDRDHLFEYTDHRDQARRDLLAAPRPRPRRESDVGPPRERPASIAGAEEVGRRIARGDGRPVTTRGFPLIDNSQSVRREYRYPRDQEPIKSTKDDAESVTRRRSTREAPREPVSLHQDRRDGYSSATDEVHRSTRSRRSDDPERKAVASHLPRHEDETARAEDKSKSKRTHERRSSATRDEPRRHRTRPREGDREHVRAESAYRERDRDKASEREYVRRREPVTEKERETATRDREDDSERERRSRRKHHDTQDRGADDHKDERRKSHGMQFVEGAAALTTAAAAAAAAGAHARRRYEHQDDESNALKIQGLKDEGRSSNKTSKDIAVDQSDADEDAQPERRERRRSYHRERKRRDTADMISRGNETARGLDGNDLSRSSARDSRSNPLDDRRTDTKDSGRGRERAEPSNAEAQSDTTESRQVRLVSPAREPEVKPKGILKSPRPSFPEDPAPIREGVAPLKAAGKDGIPPNARWTRIRRLLVNPEALEIGNERFEVRDDYVIVLRVLSREEILAYAHKTNEIREQRRQEARREDMLALEYNERHHDHDDDDDDRPQLALDNRAYNEPDGYITSNGYTERSAGGVPGTFPHDQQSNAYPGAAGHANVNAFAPVPVPQAAGQAHQQEGNNGPNRPEVHPSTSYHRLAPTFTSTSSASVPVGAPAGVPAPSYSGPSYPIPPSLQSSYHSSYPPPLPAQQQQQQSTSVQAPTTATSYQGPAGGYAQHTFDPPPPPLGTTPEPPAQVPGSYDENVGSARSVGD